MEFVFLAIGIALTIVGVKADGSSGQRSTVDLAILASGIVITALSAITVVLGLVFEFIIA
jgi:hypothetical protein